MIDPVPQKTGALSGDRLGGLERAGPAVRPQQPPSRRETGDD
jgi:hypothetical protein